jgi:hypothetical protein
MDAKELLRMETALKDAREKVKTDLMGKTDGILAELKAIGFDYKLVENGTHKLGRPRKEKTDGVVQ